MFKTANVGSTDRIIRFVAGAILIALPFVTAISGALSWILPVVGIVLILTGLVRFCPAYRLLGVRTCPAPTVGN